MVEHGVEEFPVLAPGMTLDRMTLEIHLQLIGAGVAKVVRHTGSQDRSLASHGAPPIRAFSGTTPKYARVAHERVPWLRRDTAFMPSASLDLLRSICAAWGRGGVKAVRLETRTASRRKQYASGDGILPRCRCKTSSWCGAP
jgi:hypothetical protein